MIRERWHVRDVLADTFGYVHIRKKGASDSSLLFFKLYLGRGSASCSSWTTSVLRTLSLRVRWVS